VFSLWQVRINTNASTGRSTDEDPYDGWIVQFNSNNSPIWTTNFGGQVLKQNSYTPWATARFDPNADERINAIALGGSGAYTTLYMTGTTRCDNTPKVDFDKVSKNDYFQGTYSGEGDVFIGRFNAANTSLTAGYNSVTNTHTQNLRVSPNPSNGIFDVKYNSVTNDVNATIKVLNTMGQVVTKTTSQIHNKQARFSIDLSNLPSGIYILSVNDESTTLVKK
jgi:hypothetical protein